MEKGGEGVDLVSSVPANTSVPIRDTGYLLHTVRLKKMHASLPSVYSGDHSPVELTLNDAE